MSTDAAPDSTPETFDIVVIGAGGAGMAAALFSAIAGRRTLLIERTGQVGGTTAYSAGTAWIPNTMHAEALGADDSIEKAAHFLRQAVGNHSGEDVRRTFLESGPKAVAALEAHSEVKFRARPFHPDYLAELDGSTEFGRAIEPLPFDGRKLGSHFALLRDPIPEFTILGGMMVDRDDARLLLGATQSWSAFTYSARLLARHAADRLQFRRGTRLVMGNALCGRLLYSLIQRRVRIWTDSQVEDVLRTGRKVTGLSLVRNGARMRLEVHDGVILATGGFNRHSSLRKKLVGELAHCPGAPGHTGEMHDLALRLGARHGEGNLDHAVWAPVSVRRRSDGSTAVFPHFFLDRGKPGMIAVNKAGRRFVSESTSYHLFVRGMYKSHESVPSIPAYLITDREGLRKYGLGMVRPGLRGLRQFLEDEYLVEAATLNELARKLGIEASGLEDSVRAMNAYAETGTDPEFRRGATIYERATNGDLKHGPNPCLGPIRTAPFFAVRLFPGDIGAATGLVTDANARLLDEHNRPIEGLYACGNDMNSIMGGTYPGPGINIGPGLTFAYIAAQHAARTSRGEAGQ